MVDGARPLWPQPVLPQPRPINRRSALPPKKHSCPHGNSSLLAVFGTPNCFCCLLFLPVSPSYSRRPYLCVTVFYPFYVLLEENRVFLCWCSVETPPCNLVNQAENSTSLQIDLFVARCTRCFVNWLTEAPHGTTNPRRHCPYPCAVQTSLKFNWKSLFLQPSSRLTTGIQWCLCHRALCRVCGLSFRFIDMETCSVVMQKEVKIKDAFFSFKKPSRVLKNTPDVTRYSVHFSSNRKQLLLSFQSSSFCHLFVC